MIFLFAAEILVVAGAAAGMVRMRRAGDREWRRHRLLAEAAPIIKALAEFKVALGEALIPSLRKAAAAVQDFTDTLDRHDAVTRELVRLTLGGRPDRPELVHPLTEGSAP